MRDTEGSLETTLSWRARPVVVLLGLGLAALTLVAAASAREADGRPFPGLFIDPHGSFSTIWWPSWGADRPPLQFPDRLIAIDGEPVAEPATRFELPGRRVAARMAAAADAGRAEVRLTWDTRRGPITVSRALRRLGVEEEAFFFGLYALVGVFVLWSGLAVLVLAGRRAGAQAYAGWSVGTFVFLVTFFDYHSTARLAPLFSLSTICVQICIVWLAYSFPEPPRPRRWLRGALVAFTAFELAAAVVLVAGPYCRQGHALAFALRVAVGLMAPASLLVLPLSVFLKLRGERGPRRQELLSSAWGLAAGPVVVAVGFLLLLLTGATAVHLLLPFLAPLIPLSVGYALIRHNILGTTAVLTRRMFAVPVLAGALAAALIVWLGVHAALQSRSGSALAPWVAAAFTLAALGVTGVRSSGRIFFAATARFRPTLQELADDLASKSNLPEIQSAIQKAVMRWLPTERAEVVPPNELGGIPHRPEKLRTRMAAGVAVWTTEPHWRRHLLVPMRSQGGLRGVLMLAPKHEAALYTREDLDLLETIASLGAVALHNAEVFAELEAMRRAEADAARYDKRLVLGLLGAEISHEIAYPLNFLRYLLREGDPRGADGARPLEPADLQAAREEIERLERMFATLHKLKIPAPDVVPVLVLPRVRRAIDLIRETLESSRITVAIDVPPDLTIDAEPDRLVQIFANLLRNAAQAVAPGSGIGVRSRRQNGGAVALEVWDEGPGVSDELGSAIFNPFVSGKEKGMGLGLAVTHRLVRGFGWSIGVRREAGQTVFGIEIPGGAVMKILIVDDQSSARRVLASIVAKLGDTEIREAATLAEARAVVETEPLDVALIDVRLSADDTRNRDGLTLVEELRARTTVVPIVVTASQEMAEIRLAMRKGAYDYILKDDLCDELVLPVLAGIGSRRRLEHEVAELRARRPDAEPIASRLVGVSRPMELLRETIRRAALSDRPVLVTGPTGAGKELVVGALHTLGPHPDEPLLDLNCSAIPEALMESQLFGHRKGAFTGADQNQQGYFTLVQRGTLFLDEVAELPLALQAKLLRVLETGRFRPVGAPAEGLFEGRVIAATCAELEERVRTGRFREDLYYRLNVLTIRVPPLADRREDIPALVAQFCRGQTRPLRFTSAALDVLARASWPGHVRQLRNLVDRLAVFADDDLVTPEMLTGFLHGAAPASERELGSLRGLAQAILRLPVENKVEAIEEALMAEAVALSEGNKSAAARLLGVHRKAISRRI